MWHLPHSSGVSSSHAVERGSAMSWERWQSVHTGVSGFAPSPSDLPCTLFAQVSETPWWQRAQVLVQSPSRPALHAFLRAWMEALYALRAGAVRWHLDVDPIEF